MLVDIGCAALASPCHPTKASPVRAIPAAATPSARRPVLRAILSLRSSAVASCTGLRPHTRAIPLRAVDPNHEAKVMLSASTAAEPSYVLRATVPRNPDTDGR